MGSPRQSSPADSSTAPTKAATGWCAYGDGVSIPLTMIRVAPVGACIALALVAGCGRPDTQALKKLACEQVATSIDLQSVVQLDALRKALGLAPGVDPIASCRALGVQVEPRPQQQGTGDGGET